MSLRKLTPEERASRQQEQWKKEHPNYKKDWHKKNPTYNKEHRLRFKANGFSNVVQRCAELEKRLLDDAVELEQIKMLAKKFSLR